MAEVEFSSCSQFFLPPTKFFGVRLNFSGAIRNLKNLSKFLSVARIFKEIVRGPHLSGSGKSFHISGEIS